MQTAFHSDTYAYKVINVQMFATYVRQNSCFLFSMCVWGLLLFFIIPVAIPVVILNYCLLWRQCRNPHSTLGPEPPLYRNIG